MKKRNSKSHHLLECISLLDTQIDEGLEVYVCGDREFFDSVFDTVEFGIFSGFIDESCVRISEIIFSKN